MKLIRNDKAARSIWACMLMTPFLVAIGGCQSTRMAASDPTCRNEHADADVQITVTKQSDNPLTCEIDVDPSQKCSNLESDKHCLKIQRDKWVRWQATDGAGNAVNFELLFSPFQQTQTQSKDGCAREKIDKPKKKINHDSGIEYKYTVLITDGVCSGEFKDPRIRVED